MSLNDKVLPGSCLSAGVCDHVCKRYTQQMFTIQGFNSEVWTHGSCVCNEVIALKNRHQLCDGSTYRSHVDLRRPLRKLIKTLEPCSEQYVIAHAVSSRKKLLEAAQNSLAKYGLEKRDAYVKMFLKDDKYHDPEYKAPRCIQYRNKRYGLRLATYLHPIEQHVIKIKHNGTHVFAKGRNMKQRGRDIAAKLLPNWVAISMDHSKFDSHVNESLLGLEHWYYNSCIRNPELRQLLEWQRVNRGITKNGTKYTTKATRMSGDQNTGLGNCIINYAMTKSMLIHLNIPHNLYIDGDDFIVFVHKKHQHLIDPKWYNQFGMKTTLDQVTGVLEHIDFCQCRPVFDGDKYTLVRNPKRLLSRLPWIVGPIQGRNPWDIMASAAQCEISLGYGLPVGQFIGFRAYEYARTRGGKFKANCVAHYRHRQERMKPGNLEPVECAPGVRISYERAWGISIPQQYLIENALISGPHEEEWDNTPFDRKAL